LTLQHLDSTSRPWTCPPRASNRTGSSVCVCATPVPALPCVPCPQYVLPCEKQHAEDIQISMVKPWLLSWWDTYTGYGLLCYHHPRCGCVRQYSLTRCSTAPTQFHQETSVATPLSARSSMHSSTRLAYTRYLGPYMQRPSVHQSHPWERCRISIGQWVSCRSQRHPDRSLKDVPRPNPDFEDEHKSNYTGDQLESLLSMTL
jgi:hypothetical protein